MTISGASITHPGATLCGVVALVVSISVPCTAQQSVTGQPVDTRCERMTSQQPIPANDHAIDSTNYPLLSVMNGEAGNVVLDFRINVDGSVADVKVVRSSGYARLDGAAVDAVTGHWRYKPLFSGGQPIACRHQAAVGWRLPVDPVDLASYGFAVVRMHAADYPAGTSAKSEQGATGISLAVGKDGSVFEVRLFHSSGYPELDNAAMADAKSGKWPVTPAMIGGRPLRTTLGLFVVWSR